MVVTMKPIRLNRKRAEYCFESTASEETTWASSKPTRICTAPFEEVKRRSSPCERVQIWCVCSYMAGLAQAWGYKFVCVCVCLNCHFAPLKRGWAFRFPLEFKAFRGNFVLQRCHPKFIRAPSHCYIPSSSLAHSGKPRRQIVSRENPCTKLELQFFVGSGQNTVSRVLSRKWALGRLIFVHLQCRETLSFLAVQRQWYINFRVHSRERKSAQGFLASSFFFLIPERPDPNRGTSQPFPI